MIPGFVGRVVGKFLFAVAVLTAVLVIRAVIFDWPSPQQHDCPPTDSTRWGDTQ
jgi:hypothetical protein